MSDLAALSEAVTRGDRAKAKALTQASLDAGVAPRQIVDDALVAGMAVVGERFKRGEIFVPEMLIAARAMKESMALLEPLLVKAGFTPKFTAVIGTVHGDMHDIGKNLVAMMWKGANIGVVDLGTNVPVEKFIAAVREHKASVVGLSALLTTTMPAMRETVAALHAAGLDGLKVLVGGAPVTREFAQQIGADGYASDAASAVDEAMRLIAA